MSDRIPTLYEASRTFPTTNNTGMPTWTANSLLSSKNVGRPTSSVIPIPGRTSTGGGDQYLNMLADTTPGTGATTAGTSSADGSWMNTVKSLLGYGGNDLPYGPDAFKGVTDPKTIYGMSAANQAALQAQGPGLMDWLSTGMNIYNVFNQNKLQKEYLNMAREQLGMAREQWNMTKDEVSRIAKVRNNLNQGYQTGSYKASPESKTYA